MPATKRAAPAKMQPPMTPMIDVTFNLLIFFLLTPSFGGADGFLTTNLPDEGPGSRPPPMREPIRVELFDTGARGEDVAIVLAGTRSLGANFDALRAAHEDLRMRGISPSKPVLIAPTMATRHKWVVKAFDAVVAARFTDVEFAVPYE